MSVSAPVPVPSSRSRICVYAGSSAGADPRFVAAARALGRALVRRGHALVYGGGSIGLMGAIADEVLAAGGQAIGVLPEALDRREVRHAGLTELHVVRTIHERKALMADLAGGFVALPGGFGTLEELMEAITWTQLGFHDKPVGLLDVGGFWGDLERQLDHMTRERFVAAAHRRLLHVARDPEALLDRLAAWRPAPLVKWRTHGEGRELVAVPPRGPSVGVSAVIVRDGRVLLGRRLGAHGAGTFAFPGGKPDPGEAPEAAVARELLEETGLVALRIRPLVWTNDLFPEEGLHFVTLHHQVEVAPDAQPVLREPDKCAGWQWHPLPALPRPLFGPAEALLATGWPAAV